MNTSKLSAILPALSLVMGITMASPAHAGPVSLPGSTIVPMIVAGVPPDSPANRVDPNQPTSPFSGVVSINIRYANGDSFICSGTLVSKRHVVTAAHCIDSSGNGTLIDITAAGNDVRAVFNASTVVGNPGRAIVTATGVSMSSTYQGFGNCPYPTTTDFCVNDDVAVITLGQDAPDSATIYRAFTGNVATGQLITMVGYGRSGDGINGFTTGPDFRIKRSGQNIMDLFDRDDELMFLGGPQEVWYADFDGSDKDTFCTMLSVCTPILANDKETTLGGGDSGGPAFLFAGDEYFLLGNDTFGGTFEGQIPGSFGTYFGGILLSAYVDYLEDATGGLIQTVPGFAPGTVPEPATYALLLAGAGLIAATASRRKTKERTI